MACCCELQNTLDVEVTQDALLDVEIGGSAGVLLQAKSVEVTANGTSVVAPDDGFDGLKSVEINTKVQIDGVIFKPDINYDAISFVRLLSDKSVIENVQHIVDTNDATYDMYSKSVFQYVNADFVLRCKRILGTGLQDGFIPTTANDIVFLDLEEIEGSISHARLFAPGNKKIKKVYAPKFKGITRQNYYQGIIAQSSSLEEFYAPSFERIYMIGGGEKNTEFRNNTKLRKVVLGKLTNTGTGGEFGGCPNLIHLEIGEGTGVNVKFGTSYGYEWSPTNALDENRTDLIEEGSTAKNNLQQFLSNFRDYIALRLTDNGSGLTLTLSQEVRNAIHAAEATYGIENIIITQKGWTISPAPN